MRMVEQQIVGKGEFFDKTPWDGELGMAERTNCEESKGRYANYLKIGRNAFEILLVFGQLYLDDCPPERKPEFHTRIVTTPVYAKAFLKVLAECIDLHERTFGVIPDQIVEFAMEDKGWTI
jgi:hypothetical protein